MKKRTQGMNWIGQVSRLAIYLRDGLACCYCGAGVEQAERLTLDHLKPYSKGGSNAATNLVTCCLRCNSARGVRPVAVFVRAVAEYTDTDATEIAKHVRACAKRALPREEARAMIARRGSCAKALAS
jgi:5-methylcytosine-specific restriction endonuclease McrA